MKIDEGKEQFNITSSSIEEEKSYVMIGKRTKGESWSLEKLVTMWCTSSCKSVRKSRSQVVGEPTIDKWKVFNSSIRSFLGISKPLNSQTINLDNTNRMKQKIGFLYWITELFTKTKKGNQT